MRESRESQRASGIVLVLSGMALNSLEPLVGRILNALIMLLYPMSMLLLKCLFLTPTSDNVSVVTADGRVIVVKFDDNTYSHKSQ